MGTLVEASVTVHSPYDSNSLQLRRTKRVTEQVEQEDDRDSVIDRDDDEEEEDTFVTTATALPLTIDTSFTGERNSRVVRSISSDTDSGFEKSISTPCSPKDSPGSTDSAGLHALPANGHVGSMEPVLEDQNQLPNGLTSVKRDTNNSSRTSGCLHEHAIDIDENTQSSPSDEAPLNDKGQNAISEGFINLGFDESESDPLSHSNTYKTSTLAAHELALTVGISDYRKSTDNSRRNDFPRLMGAKVPPYYRREKSSRLYWILLGVVLVLILIAVICIPLLWPKQGDTISALPAHSNSTTAATR